MTNNISSKAVLGLSIIGLLIILQVDGQRVDESELASQALNSFALNLFALTAEELETSNINLALSPYTVWSLLAIIAEGAQGNTAREMDLALGLQNNKDSFRRSYVVLKRYLDAIRGNGVNLELTSNVFTANNQQLKTTYENVVRNTYNVSLLPVDFNNMVRAANIINDIVARATKNKVTNIVTPDDLKYAEIVLTSTLYFKGMWGIPFNKTVTSKQPFYDEMGRPIGEVSMMYQVAYYPYTLISELNSWAVELPYGQDGKVSMIVLLPRQGERLTKVLQRLSKSSIAEVIRKLDESAQMFEDENVQVYLPKFHVNSDLTLNGVLKGLGIVEVFDHQKADLLGMFPHYVYLTRVFQKANIAVDEDGTVATSAAGASIMYKQKTPKFIANRSFAYFIIDKTTRSIIFMGTITNPHSINSDYE